MKQVTTIAQLLGAAQREQETKLVEFRRWTDGDGKPLTFRIRELSYDEVEEIRSMHKDSDIAPAIIAKGVVEPNLREESLQRALGVATPYEAIRKMLKAGEVLDLQIAIERLSGYRGNTLKLMADIEKN